jgi:hypothetical protein
MSSLEILHQKFSRHFLFLYSVLHRYSCFHRHPLHDVRLRLHILKLLKCVTTRMKFWICNKRVLTLYGVLIGRLIMLHILKQIFFGAIVIILALLWFPINVLRLEAILNVNQQNCVYQILFIVCNRADGILKTQKSLSSHENTRQRFRGIVSAALNFKLITLRVLIYLKVTLLGRSLSAYCHIMWWNRPVFK